MGAGIDLISACDVRYCSEKTLFSIKVSSLFLPIDLQADRLTRWVLQEVDIGLAADVGSLQRLPKITANASLLYDLALTARNFGPDEAVKLGLVSKVVEGGREEVTKEALKLAELIACTFSHSMSILSVS